MESVFQSEERNDWNRSTTFIDLSFQSSLREPTITVNDIKTSTSEAKLPTLEMTRTFLPSSLHTLSQTSPKNSFNEAAKLPETRIHYEKVIFPEVEIKIVEKGSNEPWPTDQLSINLRYSLPHSCRWLLLAMENNRAPKKRAVSFES